MRYLLLYIYLVLTLGCDLNSGKGGQEIILIEDGMNYYGKKINDRKAVALDEFDILANNTDTLFVKLKAGISEVCQEDGCWFRINLHSGKRMIVKIENDAFVIPSDVSGKHVLIEGKSFIETVPEDVMKHYAKQAGELQWIIDTIHGDHIERIFIASSVVITE